MSLVMFPQTPSTPPHLYRRTTDTYRHTPADAWARTRSYNRYKASCSPTQTLPPAAGLPPAPYCPWDACRAQPAHVFLEERLSPHHQMRKYGLIRCVIAEMLVAREHIMHESCSATPVTEDKYRVVLQRFVRQQLLIAFVLQGSQCGKHAANGFRQPEFTFVRGIYFTSLCNGVERFPVCTDQCVNRQFVEF